MAITKTLINNDPAALASFLQRLVPEYFSTVEYDDTNGILSIYDADDNLLFTFSGLLLDLSTALEVRSYADDQNYVSKTYGLTSSNHAVITYGWTAKYGALIGVKYNPSSDTAGGVLITKTNNGKTAFVITDRLDYSTVKFGTTFPVAWGDVAPITKFEFAVNEKNQTEIAAFPTNSAVETVSYTPNAGCIIAGSNYSMADGGIITVDGTKYLTNGYWAIEDE